MAEYNGRGRKSIGLLKEEVARGEIFVKGQFIAPTTDKHRAKMEAKPGQIQRNAERTTKKRQTLTV